MDMYKTIQVFHIDQCQLMESWTILMLGVSHYLKNEFFVLVYRVLKKVIFSPTLFSIPFHFVTHCFIVIYKVQKVLFKKKTQHEIVEFCYDLHLM
jgi:predicted membrane protein